MRACDALDARGAKVVTAREVSMDAPPAKRARTAALPEGSEPGSSGADASTPSVLERLGVYGAGDILTKLASLFTSRKRERVEVAQAQEVPVAEAGPSDSPGPSGARASVEVNRETKRVLLEQLSCPVCLCSPLLPPARQCPNGHLLCDACSKQPACAKCPTCRSAPTNIRCLALEKVASAEGMQAPCPHCDIDVPFSSYSEHTATCARRPTLCLKSSLAAFARGPGTRGRIRRSGQHEAPDIVLSPLRPVAFGRSSASSTRPLDVRIHHSEVSRRHCEVGLDPTGAWIVDRSSNGTYLNGERIPRAVEVRLQHGDR